MAITLTTTGPVEGNAARCEIAARLLVSLLLILAGIDKLGVRSDDLAGTLLGHYLRTNSAVTALGIAEGALGGWMLASRRPNQAWLMASTMFAVFSIVLWRHVWRGDTMTCGCTGQSGGALGAAREPELIWSAGRASLMALGCLTYGCLPAPKRRRRQQEACHLISEVPRGNTA